MTEDPDDDLNDNPAVWHGLAENLALPPGDRLECALKACDLYLARLEKLQGVRR